MREWIEITSDKIKPGATTVLPRMREWIEIEWDLDILGEELGSPSYEGVD